MTTRPLLLFMLSAVMKLDGGESGTGQYELSMRHAIFLCALAAVVINQKNTED